MCDCLFENDHSISFLLCDVVIRLSDTLFSSCSQNFFKLPHNNDLWKHVELSLYTELDKNIKEFLHLIDHTYKSNPNDADSLAHFYNSTMREGIMNRTLYSDDFIVMKVTDSEKLFDNNHNSRQKLLCNFIWILNDNCSCKFVLDERSTSKNLGDAICPVRGGLYMFSNSVVEIKNNNPYDIFVVYGKIIFNSYTIIK